MRRNINIISLWSFENNEYQFLLIKIFNFTRERGFLKSFVKSISLSLSVHMNNVHVRKLARATPYVHHCT